MARKEDAFLLVSLKEAESKKLAQVISNETSRQILAYLVDKSASESEISQQMGIPMPTVHYNLQQLIKTGLVEAKEFHYSEKGKEINHYSLAKKYIIIAPKTEGIKTRLRSILPVAIIAVAVAGLIQLFTTSIGSFGAAKEMVAESALEAAPAVEASTIAESAGAPIALWFLIGAVFAIVLYLLFVLIRKR